MERQVTAADLSPVQVRVLLVTAMVSSAAGLTLELLLVAQASYLMGDATLATGVVVGTFLASMGVGAWLTEFIGLQGQPLVRLLRALMLVEISLFPICLLGPLALFWLFSINAPLWLATVLLTVLVGVLGGMELPLITRMLETQDQLRRALARVLALDYFGSLIGALAFPLVLLPWLGLLPTASVLAFVPVGCSLALALVFPCLRRWRKPLLALLPMASVAGVLIAPMGDRIEDRFYGARVIERKQSRFQRIVMTRSGADLRLFLDGDLQFSSLDEYRYHEALVHPAMALHPAPRRILLMGAGDGLALREVLRWPDVETVDVVELDPEVIKLARRQPLLRRLNADSLRDPRVQLHFGDAYAHLRSHHSRYDVVIADFPDPDTLPVARLYSVGFYRILRQRLNPEAVVITQASTPFLTPRVLASIEAGLRGVGFHTRPYSVAIPSFGPWGFVIARENPWTNLFRTIPFSTRWLDADQLSALFIFPRDLRPDASESVQANRMTRPILLDYLRDDRRRRLQQPRPATPPFKSF